jgi:hypothetical protein
MAATRRANGFLLSRPRRATARWRRSPPRHRGSLDLSFPCIYRLPCCREERLELGENTHTAAAHTSSTARIHPHHVLHPSTRSTSLPLRVGLVVSEVSISSSSVLPLRRAYGVSWCVWHGLGPYNGKAWGSGEVLATGLWWRAWGSIIGHICTCDENRKRGAIGTSGFLQDLGKGCPPLGECRCFFSYFAGVRTIWKDYVWGHVYTW